MVDEEKYYQKHSLIICTDKIGKIGNNVARKLKGRGWSRDRMIRFQKLQMEIKDVYDNYTAMMKILGQYSLKNTGICLGK